MVTLKKNDCEAFFLQETISVEMPGKRYANKIFLLHTWEEIYKKYCQQEEFHIYGKVALSTLMTYKPKNIKLVGCTPFMLCLCNKYLNVELLKRNLILAGLKGINLNKYKCLAKTMFLGEFLQYATQQIYSSRKCIERACNFCGTDKLKKEIEDHLENQLLILEDKEIVFWQWSTVNGIGGNMLKLQVVGGWVGGVKKAPLHVAINILMEQLK